MDEHVRVTCFGGHWGKQDKRKINRSKENKRWKEVPTLNISPLSSMNSDEGIKAHRLLEKHAKEAYPQQVDATTELASERALRQSLEEQLAVALNVNAELKLALTLREEEQVNNSLFQKFQSASAQAKKESAARAELDSQLAAAKREASAMRAALNAARAQRDDLEAELMEAALDVIDSKKHHASLASSIKHEIQMREMMEKAIADAEFLKDKLQASESAKTLLEERVQAMTMESHKWEMALDSLQDQLESALLSRPLESVATAPFCPAPLTPSIEAPKPAVEAGKEDLAKNYSFSPMKVEPWRQVVIQKPNFVGI